MQAETEVLTPEQAQDVVQQRLHAVYGDLTAKRDEWVRHRADSGKEQMWRKAQSMYEGKDPNEARSSMESYLRDGPSKRKKATKNRSQVVVNIVAPKVDALSARVCEILLPVDDRNWGMKPTPDPELSEHAKSRVSMGTDSTGQPVTVGDGAKASQVLAKKAAEAMERKVDDVLTECGFNGHERRMIEDAVKLGTGVIRGPYPVNRTRKVYQQGPDGYSRQPVTNIRPASVMVSCWDVFPDPACGNDHQRGCGIFERRPMTRKELRGLVGIPGYDESAIRAILSESPKKVRVAEGRVTREVDAKVDSYEMWVYTGDIEPEQFGLLSVRTNLNDDNGDPLMVERGTLVMVNDRVIGALESWSDDLPYDFFVWNQDDDSPFGIGLPERLETQQRVVNAAWRQVMDNASLTAGPQIVILKHLLTPADGNWEIESRKVWVGREDLDDVKKAFAIFDFPSRTPELMEIANAAIQMADQESSAPTMMQGDQGGAPDTVGGMTLLMNSANSPLRHRVKLFDDQVTRPHLRRYYDYMMDNDEDEEVKGDFEVDARGSSTLIERDIQNQAMLNVAQLSLNPVFGPLIQQKAASALRAILKTFKIDPDDFVPSDDEMEQQAQAAAQQPPPEDPQLVRSKTQLEIKQLEMQDRDEDRAFEAASNERELEYKHASLQYNSNREQSEHEIAMTQEANKRDLALLKMASDKELSISELETKTGLEHLKIDNDRQLFNAEATIKARMGSGI